MRYLVTCREYDPFLTDYYDYDNCFIKGYIIFDLELKKYTEDGTTWKEIEIDTL